MMQFIHKSQSSIQKQYKVSKKGAKKEEKKLEYAVTGREGGAKVVLTVRNERLYCI